MRDVIYEQPFRLRAGLANVQVGRQSAHVQAIQNYKSRKEWNGKIMYNWLNLHMKRIR